MAWKTWNWWSNLSPLHDKWNGGIKTMAETVMFPPVDNGKNSPEAQKNLVDMLLENTSWSKKDKDWKIKLIMNWEVQEPKERQIHDHNRKSIMIKSGWMAEDMSNKLYIKKAVELANKLWALGEDLGLVQKNKMDNWRNVEVTNFGNWNIYFDFYKDWKSVHLSSEKWYISWSRSNWKWKEYPLGIRDIYKNLDEILK